MWLTDRHSFLVAVTLYGISMLYSVFLWRKGFQEDNRVNYYVMLGAFAFHTMAMAQRGFSFNRCPVNNLYEATLFIGWTVVTAYLILGAWSRLRFLGAFASPVLFALGVFALFPALDAPYNEEPVFQGGWETLHAALVLLAYGGFGLGCVAGLMFLTQDHNLRFHKFRAMLAKLPPIQRLERITAYLLTGGFIFLTVGLAVGGLALKRQEGASLFGDMKVVWSGFVWIIYLGLLIMRWAFNQGGRRLAWGAVAGFVFVMLTFWGTNLASPIHHP